MQSASWLCLNCWRREWSHVSPPCMSVWSGLKRTEGPVGKDLQRSILKYMCLPRFKERSNQRKKVSQRECSLKFDYNNNDTLYWCTDYIAANVVLGVKWKCWYFYGNESCVGWLSWWWELPGSRTGSPTYILWPDLGGEISVILLLYLGLCAGNRIFVIQTFCPLPWLLDPNILTSAGES